MSVLKAVVTEQDYHGLVDSARLAKINKVMDQHVFSNDLPADKQQSAQVNQMPLTQ